MTGQKLPLACLKVLLKQDLWDAVKRLAGFMVLGQNPILCPLNGLGAGREEVFDASLPAS